MSPSLSPTETLPARPLAHSIDRARTLCGDAQVAVKRAAALVADSRRRESERQRWRAVWSRSGGASQLVICCAYCARVRTRNGEWGAIPASLSQEIHRSAAVRLSHGFCPDCTVRHFPGDLQGSPVQPGKWKADKSDLSSQATFAPSPSASSTPAGSSGSGIGSPPEKSKDCGQSRTTC